MSDTKTKWKFRTFPEITEEIESEIEMLGDKLDDLFRLQEEFSDWELVEAAERVAKVINAQKSILDEAIEKIRKGDISVVEANRRLEAYYDWIYHAGDAECKKYLSDEQVFTLLDEWNKSAEDHVRDSVAEWMEENGIKITKKQLTSLYRKIADSLDEETYAVADAGLDAYREDDD